MKNSLLLLLISFCIFGCEKEKKSEFPTLTEISKKIENDTPQTSHEDCVNKKFYPACRTLAYLYEYGGKFNSKITIKPNKEKAKFYQEILCKEHKKEYFCKKIQEN